MRSSVAVLSVLVLSTFATVSYANSSIRDIDQIEVNSFSNIHGSDLPFLEKRSTDLSGGIQKAASDLPGLEKRQFFPTGKKLHKHNKGKGKHKGKHHKGKHHKGKGKHKKNHGINYIAPIGKASKIPTAADVLVTDNAVLQTDSNSA